MSAIRKDFAPGVLTEGLELPYDHSGESILKKEVEIAAGAAPSILPSQLNSYLFSCLALTSICFADSLNSIHPSPSESE